MVKFKAYSMRRLAVLASLMVLVLALPSPAQRKKKNQEEITQVLELPKDPPLAITAEVARMSFHVTPLSGKGLLSAQMREALKALSRSTRGATVVQIRAFVAGSGDLRRVPAIVSEEFTDKRLPLPVLNVVQVGALPLEGAQVILEAIALERKPVNPSGLALISGQPSTLKDPVGPLVSIVEKMSLPAADVRRVTCFLNSLDGLSDLRTKVAGAFPKAVANYVQLQRAATDDFAECEAVAALSQKPERPFVFLSPAPGRYSQAVLLGPVKVALTGTQLAFHPQEADVRLAFERLGKALDSVKATYDNVVFTRVYPLTRGVMERVRKIRFEFLKPDAPPASTMVLFEGLPSLDASFGIDVVAVVP